jgi:NAD(P)-dependent dehydrogenase (short-subunit alcohol dehydrogenase family)
MPRTRLGESLLSIKQMTATLAGLHPLERLGIPEEVGALAACLLSPEADWITGQTISALTV